MTYSWSTIFKIMKGLTFTANYNFKHSTTDYMERSNQNMYTIAGTGCLNGILVNPSSVGVIRHQIGHRMEREARNVVSVPYTGSRIFGVV